MSFKLSDAIHLSWTNILEHKGRSLVVVLTISVLFAIVMSFNFIFQGMENTFISANLAQTQHAVYTTVNYTPKNSSKIPQSHEITDASEAAAIIKNKGEPKNLNAITERAQLFQGEIVGNLWSIQLNYPYSIISASAVTEFITTDLSNVPAGKVPILMPKTGFHLEGSSSELETFFNENFYPVGTLPSPNYRVDSNYPLDYHSYPTIEGGNLLNPLLELVDSGPSQFLIIDDGSLAVEDFFVRAATHALTVQDSANATITQNLAVARFDSLTGALKYGGYHKLLGFYRYNPESPYSINDLFGGMITTTYNFGNLKLLLIMIEITLIVVAVIISIATFKHLVSMDAQTIALYYSLGASTGNIYCIYLLYILELCLAAILACFLISFIIVSIIALINTPALSATLEAYYQLNTAPKIHFFGIEPYFWTIIASIILVAPLSLGFSTHYFQSSYIARKLK